MALHDVGTSDDNSPEMHKIETDVDAAEQRGNTDLNWIEEVVGARHKDLESGFIPDGPMPGIVAYNTVHDQVALDGNASLNLATFVSTWMDDHARRLYSESYDKNMIDKDEYPQTAAIEEKCAKVIANLWHAPEGGFGTSTIGSSEACMLAGMAMKRRWQQARRKNSLSTDKPNLVMSSAVQVVTKVARFRRELPSSASSSCRML